jgi:hypothetical protein
MAPGFPLRALGLVAAVTMLALATCSNAFAWDRERGGDDSPGVPHSTRVLVPDNAMPSVTCPTDSQETPGVPGCGHIHFTFFNAGIFTVTVTLDCSSLPDPSTCFAQDISPAVCLEHAPVLGSSTGNCPVMSAAPGTAEGLEAQTVVDASGRQVSNCSDPIPNSPPGNADGSTTYTITCNVIPGTYELVVAGDPVNTCDPNALDFFLCSMNMAGPGAYAKVTWMFTNGAVQIGPGNLRVRGAGQVFDNTQEFGLWAQTNRPEKTRSIFRKHSRAANCYFWATDTPTFQTITRNPVSKGGDATIKGNGWARVGNGPKMPVTYTETVHDSGQRGNGDTYSLSNGVCDNGGMPQPVVKGDIDIDQIRSKPEDD